MTKTQFKKEVDYHNYVGGIGVHAFYYDYLRNENCQGYKWLVYCRKQILLPDGSMRKISKDELLEAFYQLVFNNVDLPYYINCKFAETDEQRFKIKIGL